jgi:hypothetical protein
MLSKIFITKARFVSVSRSRIIFMRLRFRGKIFYAAPAAPALAPILLYSKTKFLKRTKV